MSVHRICGRMALVREKAIGLNNEKKQIMRILVFDNIGKGHHIEYVHHLYTYAGEMMTNDTFVFVLATELLHNYKVIDVNKYPNIQVVAISEEENYQIQRGIFRNWRNWYHDYKLLRKYIKLYQPEKVILNALHHFMPFLSFSRIGKGILSGILYIIPGRKPKSRPFINKWADEIRLFLYAKGYVFRHVFLLNDAEYPGIYNKKYKTKVFKFLPDPYVDTPLPATVQTNHVNINTQKKVFLHFGGMGYRKGTFDILKAIELLNNEDKKKCLFIFAGVISNPNMHKQFIETVNRLKKEIEIVFIEGFIPFEELGYLCSITDYILVPYKNVEQSSGVINYAAQFGKSVIGPTEGLLGYLIEKYHLGYTLKQTNGKALANFFRGAIDNEHISTIDGNEFIKNASPENFARIMLNS